MRNYQCSACSGKICVVQCDRKPEYCPHYEHKDPCWVDVDQESQTRASTDLKEGDWAWGPVSEYSDDEDAEEYFKVSEVMQDGILFGDPYLVIPSKYCQKASVRPYRGPELAQVVGKVVNLRSVHQRSFMTAALVLGCNEYTEKVFVCCHSYNGGDFVETAACLWISAEELSGLTTVDGEPCGVLQHRDPNTGELVD